MVLLKTVKILISIGLSKRNQIRKIDTLLFNLKFKTRQYIVECSSQISSCLWGGQRQQELGKAENVHFLNGVLVTWAHSL